MKMRKVWGVALRAGLAGGVLAAVALPLVLSSSASASTLGGAATITDTTLNPLSSGGSTTEFSAALPTNAACTGDTATHGYHVYSYLVPKGTSITGITFTNHPSTGYGFVSNAGVYYGSQNTANTTGQIIGIPTNFEWGPLVSVDDVSLSTLLYTSDTSGVWDAGIACANSSGTLTDYWNTQVTFTASGSDPNGFTWTAFQVAPITNTVTTTLSSAFTDQLTAANASGPVTYTVTTPATGISVSSSGAISTSGTLDAGLYTVSGTESDTGGDSGAWSYTLTVTAVTITQTAPTTGTVTTSGSAAYTHQLAETGATGTVTYTVTTPVTGLSVSSSGDLTTTGTLASGSHGPIKGTDSDVYGDTGTWTFTLTVTAVSITQIAPTTGTVSVAGSSAYTNQLAVSGATGAVTYVVTTPATGVNVSSSGAISTTGTLSGGPYDVSGTDHDGYGDTGASWSFDLTVSAGTLTQAAPTAASVTNTGSAAFTDQLAVTGANGAVSYTVTTPATGVSVSSSGAISTTGALLPNSYAVSGTDLDVHGDTGTWSFTLTVTGAADSFTSATSTSGTVGQNLHFVVTTAGTAKLKEQGKLPKGVKFNKGTHVLGGIPTSTKHKSAAGTYDLVFTAKFGKGKTKVVTTQTFTLTISS